MPFSRAPLSQYKICTFSLFSATFLCTRTFVNIHTHTYSYAHCTHTFLLFLSFSPILPFTSSRWITITDIVVLDETHQWEKGSHERANGQTNDAIKWYQTDNINLANSFAFLTTGDCPWSENILFSFFFFFLKLLECCFSTIVLWAAECGDGGGVAARLSRFSFLLGTFTEPARVSINAR